MQAVWVVGVRLWYPPRHRAVAPASIHLPVQLVQLFHGKIYILEKNNVCTCKHMVKVCRTCLRLVCCLFLNTK